MNTGVLLAYLMQWELYHLILMITPSSASRAYDKNRDGFVISGGSGMVILEDEEHAKKRNANILAKLSRILCNF